MNLSYVFNMNKFHRQYVEQNKIQKEAFSILVKVKKKKGKKCYILFRDTNVQSKV